MRIVSLVPSLTELLFYLGLEDSVVGRTKFCIHPNDKVMGIPKIGGTKKVDIDKVIVLKPDLILANKEENTKADIEQLSNICTVHVTEIANFKDAIFAIDDIGLMTQTASKATELIEAIETSFLDLAAIIQNENAPKSVCYLIWQKPYMSVGHDTYIHNMLTLCGLKNICGDHTRYPEITIDEIKTQLPEFIFLSSEPFPFREKHVAELQKLLPTSKVVLVDGEYFSWYGSRMLNAAPYFKQLIATI